MQVVFGVRDQVVEQEKRLYPTTKIPVKGLNPFQAAHEENLAEDLGALVSGALA